MVSKIALIGIGIFLLVGTILVVFLAQPTSLPTRDIHTDDRTFLPDSLNTESPKLIDTNPEILYEKYPFCGNGRCERYDGIDELTSCIKDCDYVPPILKPVCGNGKCEVFGGIDEFVTCGWGTVNDCGVQCTKESYWVNYCPPKEFPSREYDNPIIEPQPVENSKNFKIMVLYVYNSGEKNSNVINSITPSIQKTSNLFKNYNGISITPIIEEVQISYNIGDGHDIYYGYNERKKIWKELVSKTNINNEYNNYDGIWLVLAGTSGGAFSIGFKSPIYFDGTHFLDKKSGILTAHEFLHNFGCKDINDGKQGDIMGDLTITTISSRTLGDCNTLFKVENYGKTPLSELTGEISGRIFAIKSGDIFAGKDVVYTKPLETT